MKVLIADDEARFRHYLSLLLSERGHDVETAGSGRTAIDIGVRFRPELLIIDWMLKNHIHGLHVAEILRTVDERVRTVLITGFPSEDLKREASNAGILSFLEKPFPLDDVVRAVEAAGKTEISRAGPAFAVLQADDDGLLVHANQKAREVLKKLGHRRMPTSLQEICGEHVGALLESSLSKWTEFTVPTQQRSTGWCRSKHDDGLWTVVLLSEEDFISREDRLVQDLLGLSESRETVWPFAKHVLVIDSDDASRLASTDQLEALGCVCYKADNPELAIRLFEADPKIGIVLLDYNLPGVGPAAVVRELMRIRPDVTIVGVSSLVSEFAAPGVERFLLKPWSAHDLIDLLEQP